MLSGKINQQNDWNATLRTILDAPAMESSVLTVMSDGVSGSIGIRHGRYITGGVTTDGTCGVAALRQIMSVTEGFYNYLSDEGVANKREINQGLNVDIAVLLNLQLPPPPQAQPNMVASSLKPADEATSQLRKTLQRLQPVSKRTAELEAERLQAAQQMQSAASGYVHPSQEYQVTPPQSPQQGPPSGQYPTIQQGRPSQQHQMPPQGPGPQGPMSQAPQPTAQQSGVGADLPVRPQGFNSPQGSGSQGPMSGQYPTIEQVRPSQQHQMPPQGPGAQGPASGQYPTIEQGRPSQQHQMPPQGPGAQGPMSGQYPTIEQGRPSQQHQMPPQGQQSGVGADLPVRPQGFNAPPQGPGPQGPMSGQYPTVEQGRPSQQHQMPPQGPGPQGPMSGQYAAMQDRPSGQFPVPQQQQQQPEAPQPVQGGGPQYTPAQGRPSGQFPFMDQHPPVRSSGNFQLPQPQQPRTSGSYETSPTGLGSWGGPDSNGDDSFTYSAGELPVSTGTGRKRHNALDRMIYGAASTCMKLTALKHREAQQNAASAQAPPVTNPVPPVQGSQPFGMGTTPGGITPHTLPDQTPFGIEESPQPSNVVDAVRATAWKIASRVAHAAKARMETEERLQDVKRLRTVETDTADTTEAEKKKRRRWPPDGVTIAMYAAFALGGIVVIGLIYMGIQAAINKPNIVIAKKYLADGREDLALNQLTIQLQTSPSDQDALQMRAQVYENRKDYEHAGDDYAKLFELKPKVLANARKAAFNEYKAGKYDVATQICKQILEHQNDDESARAILAMGLARTQKEAESVKVSSRLDVELVPPYLVSDYFAALGYAFTRLNDPQKAIAFYGRAVKADPRNAEVLSERADAFLKVKDYKHAAADFAALTKIDPANPNNYLSLAKSLAAAADYAGAAQAYEKATKLRPTGEIYTSLAQMHFQMGKFGYAVSDCDNALALQPINKQASELRIRAMQKAKNEKALVTTHLTPEYYGAGPVNRRVAGPAPDTTHDPLTPQGYNALVGGDYQHAINVLKQAVLRTPGDTAARRFLANALVQANRDREAYDQYVVLNNVGALLPSDQIPYAECACKAGSPERGMEIYIETLHKDPTFAQARINLIRLMVARGYNAKAVEQAAEGARVNPENKQAYEEALQK